MTIRKINADVLAVPAVDVFLLTVFFIVLSGNLLYRSTIPVQLPVSSSETLTSEDNPLVTLTPGGGMFLNGRKVSKEGLSVILELTVRLAQRKGKEPTLIISADRSTAHQLIVETIDIAREAGIKNVAIATEARR